MGRGMSADDGSEIFGWGSFAKDLMRLGMIAAVSEGVDVLLQRVDAVGAFQ